MIYDAPAPYRPIILVGDSNAASFYWLASQCPPEIQEQQLSAIWCYRMYCHQSPLPAKTAQDDAWKAVSPIQVGIPKSGELMAGWVLDLAYALRRIPRVAIADAAWGGSTLNYINPTIGGGTSFTTITGWLQARLAALALRGRCEPPILVCYEGANGDGSTTPWAAGMTQVMAGFRGIWPGMPVICMKVPSGSDYPANLTEQRASVDTYVAGDPLSRVVDVSPGSFFDLNLHIDQTCGRLFAQGVAAAAIDIWGL